MLHRVRAAGVVAPAVAAALVAVAAASGTRPLLSGGLLEARG